MKTSAAKEIHPDLQLVYTRASIGLMFALALCVGFVIMLLLGSFWLMPILVSGGASIIALKRMNALRRLSWVVEHVQPREAMCKFRRKSKETVTVEFEEAANAIKIKHRHFFHSKEKLHSYPNSIVPAKIYLDPDKDTVAAIKTDQGFLWTIT